VPRMADAGYGPVDQRLAKALSHPLRARLFAVLNEQVASPNEMAGMLGEQLPNVSYHTRVLLRLGCIELVRTAPRRGAIEHYYRAVRRPFLSDNEWRRLPRSGREAIVDAGLKVVWDDVAEAVEAGTLQKRTDIHLTRSALALDERGWGELRDAVASLLEEADRIAERSGERLAAADEPGIPARLVLMHFESPPDG
jgi:DNA-binding transcriptional ArsR family regulator